MISSDPVAGTVASVPLTMKVGHSVQERKTGIRRRLLRARKSLPARQRQEKSRRILDRCRRLPTFGSAAIVCSFIGCGDEVDTSPLVRQLLREGRRVAVPSQRAGTDGPAFSELFRWQDLTPNSLGILEPDRESINLLPTASIPFFFIPGVGFDEDGRRIGLGLGYYDQALSEASPQALRIGLSFEIQIADRIPVADHDLPMDIIVTENRVIEIASRPPLTKEVC
jgi:5-formyltetrahydrofolate cyclo-ligase